MRPDVRKKCCGLCASEYERHAVAMMPKSIEPPTELPPIGRIHINQPAPRLQQPVIFDRELSGGAWPRLRNCRTWVEVKWTKRFD